MFNLSNACCIVPFAERSTLLTLDLQEAPSVPIPINHLHASLEMLWMFNLSNACCICWTISTKVANSFLYFLKASVKLPFKPTHTCISVSIRGVCRACAMGGYTLLHHVPSSSAHSSRFCIDVIFISTMDHISLVVWKDRCIIHTKVS